jgi:hypothetical protein
MTDRTVTEDARHEQLRTESVPSPDVRLPLITVEPEQRNDRVVEATGAVVGRWLCWAWCGLPGLCPEPGRAAPRATETSTR